MTPSSPPASADPAAALWLDVSAALGRSSDTPAFVAEVCRIVGEHLGAPGVEVWDASGRLLARWGEPVGEGALGLPLVALGQVRGRLLVGGGAGAGQLEPVLPVLAQALASATVEDARLRTVGDLAAGTAHELNNPLSCALGFAELLMEEDLPSEVHRQLALIVAQARRCREVIEDLLVFGRVHPMRREVFPVAELVRAAQDTGGYAWQAGHLVFDVRISPPSLTVWGDRTLLTRALYEVLRNAVESMPDGGRVQVLAESASGAGLRLVVSDEGHGVPEEILPRVFDPFFTTREVGQGRGIGLPVAYGTVAQHGGSVTLSSAPWQGTRVEIHLPGPSVPAEVP